jgi:ketosteroid isomerase-like protein
MDDVGAASTESFLEALTEHLEAISERDIDRFAETLSQDVRLVGGDGRIVEGRENVIAAHSDWFGDDRWRFEPEILWMREEGSAGWALTRVQYTEGDVARLFLLLFLFVREEGSWKLVYDQNTGIDTRPDSA